MAENFDAVRLDWGWLEVACPNRGCARYGEPQRIERADLRVGHTSFWLSAPLVCAVCGQIGYCVRALQIDGTVVENEPL